MEMVLPARVSYCDLEHLAPEAVGKYWHGRWDLDVAQSLYHWATNIDVVTNTKSEVMGTIMATTFASWAHTIWKQILAPRSSIHLLR